MIHKASCMIFVASAAVIASLPAAKADNFQFSFTNTYGDVSGTVTGEILGLTNNATSAATSVIITGFPAALDLPFTSPINVTSWTVQQQNEFTETNGQVTAGAFWATESDTYRFYLDGDGVYNFLGSDSLQVYGNNYIAADNITPLAATAVPEPASLALLGLSAGVIGLLRRRNA
jgi:hypothetical protein